ncbi:formimidoylglutamate deiminase [Streptomyces bohaiensis]|uniref:formimidoylglutamate deiminase n=1 Tax=Streptomyces bohaiensis TaxID=1431344 RepID=UPI003B7C1FB3
MSLTPQTYWAEHAWIDHEVRPAVLVAADADGRIDTVTPGVTEPPPGAVPLHGLTLPGLANAHSHAFHRALRGTSQAAPPAGPTPSEGGAAGSGPDTTGSFWTWRETMYAVADRLTPDSYHDLARAVYAEMALAGITAVGEFHYLHHAPGGTRYQDPNAMGDALAAAATAAGVRLTLLDTCYLSAGFGAPPGPVQTRFSDGDALAWARRADALDPGGETVVGAAVHSVRAVPADQLAVVGDWARGRGAPFHVHLSEQPAENADCLTHHGRTPTRLLADHGLLGPATTAVHATHLTAHDIDLLGSTATGICMCPTTERDLADGIGPAVALRDAGSPISLGSDSHAVIDLLEEARAVELDERLRTGRRGHWTAHELLTAATRHGHAALGRPDGGRIAPGAPCDLATVALDSVRTAGTRPRLAAESVVFAGTAADVRHTVVGGRHIVRDGRHQLVPRVPEALTAAVEALRG